MAFFSFRRTVIAVLASVAMATPAMSQYTPAGVTPVRPSETGLLISPPPREWPEDAVDRLSRAVDDAVARCDMAAFYAARAALIIEVAGLVVRINRASIRDESWHERMSEWGSYLNRVAGWQYSPRPACPPPTSTAMSVPMSGQKVANLVALKSKLLGPKIASESQAYCTYGSGGGSPVALSLADDSGNAIGSLVIEIDDTPRGKVPSAMDDVNIIDGDERANQLQGTRGPRPDIMTGGANKDEFWFRTSLNPNDPNSTLDDGDRITDYESGEDINIEGVQLDGRAVKLEYDPKEDETRLEIRLRDDFGREAVKTIRLDGNKVGSVSIGKTCCGGQLTTITIDIPKTSRNAGPPAPQSVPPPPRPVQQGDKSEPKSEKSADKEKTAPGENPTPPSDTTLHIKATEAVLAGQTTATELKGQLVKLVALETPDLPKSGARKPPADVGHDRSPVTCTTGANGQCRTTIVADERPVYGFPALGPANIRADLSLRPNTGMVIEKTGLQETDMPGPPPGAILTKSDFKIGGKTFTRADIRAPDQVSEDLLKKHKDKFGARFQVDYCAEKKPGPPLGTTPLSYSTLNRELPSMIVKLVPLARQMLK